MTEENNRTFRYRPTPVDFLILELLPEKGMIGGLHWKGRRARDVRTEIIETQGVDASLLTTATIQSRLRSMTVANIVESFPGVGAQGGNIWARTPEGTKLLATKEEVLGG
jgi:hypothetical protein